MVDAIITAGAPPPNSSHSILSFTTEETDIKAAIQTGTETEESRTIYCVGYATTTEVLDVKVEQVEQQEEDAWPRRNISQPHPNDVLCGRGGGTNHHVGNKRFRKLVEDRKVEYMHSKRLEKPLIALDIVQSWRVSQDPPGRFLKYDKRSGLWQDVGNAEARKKTSQALREQAPLFRVLLADKEGNEEDEEEDNSNKDVGEVHRLDDVFYAATTDAAAAAIVVADATAVAVVDIVDSYWEEEEGEGAFDLLDLDEMGDLKPNEHQEDGSDRGNSSSSLEYNVTSATATIATLTAAEVNEQGDIDIEQVLLVNHNNNEDASSLFCDRMSQYNHSDERIMSIGSLPPILDMDSTTTTTITTTTPNCHWADIYTTTNEQEPFLALEEEEETQPLPVVQRTDFCFSREHSLSMHPLSFANVELTAMDAAFDKQTGAWSTANNYFVISTTEKPEPEPEPTTNVTVVTVKREMNTPPSPPWSQHRRTAIEIEDPDDKEDIITSSLFYMQPAEEQEENKAGGMEMKRGTTLRVVQQEVMKRTTSHQCETFETKNYLVGQQHGTLSVKRAAIQLLRESTFASLPMPLNHHHDETMVTTTTAGSTTTSTTNTLTTTYTAAIATNQEEEESSAMMMGRENPVDSVAVPIARVVAQPFCQSSFNDDNNNNMEEDIRELTQSLFSSLHFSDEMMMMTTSHSSQETLEPVQSMTNQSCDIVQPRAFLRTESEDFFHHTLAGGFSIHDINNEETEAANGHLSSIQDLPLQSLEKESSL